MPKVEQYKFAIHQIIVLIKCSSAIAITDLEALGKKKASMEQMEAMELMDILEFHPLMLVVISHELALNQVQVTHLLHKILEVKEDIMDIPLFQRLMIMVIFHGLKNI